MKVTNEQIMLALLNCHTQKEAAAVLGVTEQTVSKRIREPADKLMLTGSIFQVEWIKVVNFVVKLKTERVKHKISQCL